MSEELEGRSSVLKAWMLMHRTRDLAVTCPRRLRLGSRETELIPLAREGQP